LATSNGRVLAFQANDSAVYFVDQSGLQSVPLTGGGVQALSNAVPLQAASGLAVVGSSVVVTTNGTVYSVPVGGGTPTTLATPWASASRGPQPNAVFPMACGSDICWWTGASNSLGGPTGPGFIARLAGGSVTTISAPVGPASLSFDGTDFFETVGCDLCTGTLYRVPASGGEMVIMAQGWYAVVEGAYVYFSVAGGFNLPSSYDGGVPGSGIYGIDKSCEPVQRDM
jgi:hypothetical protein